MYYTFKCTYCGRAFYTYDRNRHHASVTLYRAVKNHLIEYNEDHKEHEMDDGEQEDSNQIFAEMKETATPPVGGFNANAHNINPIKISEISEKPKEVKEPPKTVHHHTDTPKIMVALILFCLILILGAVIFIPGIMDFLIQIFVNGSL